MKNKISPIVITVLITITHLAIIANYAHAEVEPRFLQIDLRGLKANTPLPDTLFSTTLIGENKATFVSHDSIGPFEAGSFINGTTQHALPPDVQSFAFYANLTAHAYTIFEVEGIVDLENTVSRLTSLKMNSTVLKSTNSTSLKFTSVGIVGSIRIEILPKTNIESLTATLLWKGQMLVKNSPNASSPLTFEDLKSNLPEIPFEVNITDKNAQSIVFAIGTLKVDSEKISMPFAANYWNPHAIAGWNITFKSAQYAKESILPIVVSGESSEIVDPPGAYTADFREKVASTPDQPIREYGQIDWIQTVLEALSMPTSLAAIAILSVATAAIIIYKARRHRIETT